MSEDSVTVIVRKKQSVVFSGEALRLTSWNEKGEFDIYPFHASFVAVISKRLELETNGSKTQQFSIERGILFVKANKVEVYLDI